MHPNNQRGVVTTADVTTARQEQTTVDATEAKIPRLYFFLEEVRIKEKESDAVTTKRAGQ